LIGVNAPITFLPRDGGQVKEDFMRNARSSGQATGRGEYDDLLGCRLAMLGLDIAATQRAHPKTFDVIGQTCASCSFRDACAVDLERDPNNPVWETYCPSAGVIIALSEERFRGDLAAS
jgi:hypothetical protein